VVAIETIDDRILDLVGQKARIRVAKDPPGWHILRASKSVAEYETLLQWTTSDDPRWRRRDFNPATLRFGFETVVGESRLSEFQDPITHRRIHKLWRGGRGVIVERDWGRWLLLRELLVRAVTYDANKQTLALPATVPLPPLLGRGLSLFSGFAAERVANPVKSDLNIDIYKNIPREAADFVASHLGQVLQQSEN
jgi:hypothetical protein